MMVLPPLPPRYLFSPAISCPSKLPIGFTFFRSRPSGFTFLQRYSSPQMSINISAVAAQGGPPSSLPSAAGNGAGEKQNADVLVQYVVLRRDLIDTWPLGSIITQGCHASVAAIWTHKDDPHTADYCSNSNLDSMHKVTVEVKGEAQILNLSQRLTSGGIAHKLWIEQPENIPTCLATKPYPKPSVSAFFKKLKLCK